MNKYKIDSFYDPIERKYIYAINGIESNNEVVCIDSVIKNNYDYTNKITHIGVEEEPDTRDDYEKWKDSYFYNYIRPLSFNSISITISSDIKKIILPKTITCISYLAFQNVKGVKFEIDENNEYYYTINGSIYNKNTNKILYNYEEN